MDLMVPSGGMSELVGAVGEAPVRAEDVADPSDWGFMKRILYINEGASENRQGIRSKDII